MVGEFDHLVLDRGTVPRADALDLPAVERRSVQVLPDDRVGSGVGVAHVAEDPVLDGPLRPEREGDRVVVPRLGSEGLPVDGVPVEPHGGPRLEAQGAESECLQVPGEVDRGRFVGPPGRIALQADVDHAVEEGARGDDHGLSVEPPSVQRPDAAGTAVPDRDLRDDPLKDRQSGDLLEPALHGQSV